MYAPLRTEAGALPAFNDEVSHFTNVLFQRDAGGIPHQNLKYVDEAALATGGAEYWQPPLYYQLSALLLKFTSPYPHSIRIVRFFSLFLWYIALFMLAWSVPTHRMQHAILTVGSVLGATLPASAVVSNDALMALFVAFLFVFATIASKRVLRIYELLLLAVTMALAVYAKLPAITLWVMPLATILLYKEQPLSIRIQNTVFIGIVAFAMTMPLWIIRISVYGGPLGLRYAPPIHFRQAVAAFCYSLVTPWMDPWFSFWVKIPGVVLTLVMLVSLFLFWKKRKDILGGFDEITRRTSTAWAIGGALAGIAWVYYAFLNYQTEARLLLPATPALCIVIGWPLWSLPEKVAHRFGWAVTVLMLLPYLALVK